LLKVFLRRSEVGPASPKKQGAAEKEKLAKDTEFERMRYEDQAGQLPSVQTSIVFSGRNLSQSIHQPEVCLDAQGWEFMAQKRHEWEGASSWG
jgi:hypothetical protein